MIAIMETSWFRRIFSRAEKRAPVDAQARADSGDADAQFGLGLIFASREGGDYLKAAHWYQKAANQNHALAQFNLGLMFAAGQGVVRDDAQAVMWMQKAARQGDAGAQHNLGMRQRRAGFEGLEKDALECRLEAYKWLRLASAQGYRGSDAAFERTSLDMTREEVVEANHRTAAFTAGNPRSTGTLS
jgi:TPR repeat protein